MNSPSILIDPSCVKRVLNLVATEGFEPPMFAPKSPSFTDWCSQPFCYVARCNGQPGSRTRKLLILSQAHVPVLLAARKWCDVKDLNLQEHGPQPCASACCANIALWSACSESNREVTRGLSSRHLPVLLQADIFKLVRVGRVERPLAAILSRRLLPVERHAPNINGGRREIRTPTTSLEVESAFKAGAMRNSAQPSKNFVGRRPRGLPLPNLLSCDENSRRTTVTAVGVDTTD